jgi:hypothetical protein
MFSHNIDFSGEIDGRERKLTFHRVARLPLELGRVAAEVGVRAEDEGDFGCFFPIWSLELAAYILREANIYQNGGWVLLSGEERKGERDNKQLCMPASQYRGVMLEKLPE